MQIPERMMAPSGSVPFLVSHHSSEELRPADPRSVLGTARTDFEASKHLHQTTARLASSIPLGRGREMLEKMPNELSEGFHAFSKQQIASR